MQPMIRLRALLCATLLIAVPAMTVLAAIEPAPERQRGEGPFQRLVLREVMMVSGEGAPPIGPVDILVEGNRIAEIRNLGIVQPIPESRRIPVEDGDRVLELAGHWVLPGFVDMHGHFGGDEQGVSAEYVAKLWLAHGITTVRDPGSGNGLDWVLDHQERSAANTIAAPRLVPYVFFGQGNEGPFTEPEAARQWVRSVARQGAAGIKFFGAPRDIMIAALDEAEKQGLGSAMHHAQLDVVNWNVLDSARHGMTTMEHWYGLPEAMFEDRVIQDYPLDYNYANEQHRFGEAGRLWLQAAEPGSERWNAVRDELIERGFTLNPTLTIYEASRDLMREMNAEWHAEYTHPKLWSFFQPSFEAHGSYWFDWTTADEIAWKANFRRWMDFLEDYKNHGGRVTLGSDSGYIWKVYGFGYIREMELLQEAGFHPLEVLRSATFLGAQTLGMSDEIGSIRVGKLADLVVVPENPLRNFKVLYGTGHFRLNADNEPVRVGGVRYTIKDGIVFDAPELLADVRKIVEDARASSATDAGDSASP